jgi:hypothetical protein
MFYIVVIQLHDWICAVVTAKEGTGSNPVAPNSKWSIAYIGRTSFAEYIVQPEM